MAGTIPWSPVRQGSVGSVGWQPEPMECPGFGKNVEASAIRTYVIVFQGSVLFFLVWELSRSWHLKIFRRFAQIVSK